MKLIVSSIFFLLALHPNQSRADIINEIFRIECIPEMNTLSVTNYFNNGSLPQKSLTDNSKTLSEKYGIYSYEGNIFEFGDDFSSQTTKIFETKCTLKTKDDINSSNAEVYTVKIQGLMYTSNPNSYCGGWRSLSMSISTENRTLFSSIPFSEGCNAEREISEIVLYPHQGYARIIGSNNLKDIVFFQNGPITKCDIYATPPMDKSDNTNGDFAACGEQP